MLLTLLLAPILVDDPFGLFVLLLMLLAFVVGVWLWRWGRRLLREGQQVNGALLLLLSLLGLSFPFVLFYLIGSAL